MTSSYQTYRLTLSLLITSVLMASCASTHDDRARTALKALQKLESSTNVGVNIQEYDRLVVDANVPVQDFLRDKENKTDQKAKEHLQVALGNYKAAGYFWKKGISERIPISQEYVNEVLKPFWSGPQEEIRKAEKLLK